MSEQPFGPYSRVQILRNYSRQMSQQPFGPYSRVQILSNYRPEHRNENWNNALEQVLGAEKEKPDRRSTNKVADHQQMPQTHSWHTHMRCVPHREKPNTATTQRTPAKAS